MNKMYLKVGYNCSEEDSLWCGSTKGEGILTINLDERTISWQKTKGCDPYWNQICCAIMKATPPQLYDRTRRIVPFNVHIREGYTGCEYVYLNLYDKIDEDTYIRTKCACRFDVRMTGKTNDFTDVYFGDLVEIFRALYAERGWVFSRNPNEYVAKGPSWRFLPLHKYDIASASEVIDPIAIRKALERDPDRRDPNHHRSSHRNSRRAFNHG